MKRRKNSIPKPQSSLVLEFLIENISKEELEKNGNKLRLAIKIVKAIESTGLKRYEFAKKKKSIKAIRKLTNG